MNWLDRRTLPLVILAAGVLAALLLVLTRGRVEVKPPEARVPLVRVTEVAPETLALRVRTHGEVRPRTETDLVPEVAGTVTWVSPNLVSGGFFDEGEPLLRIDTLDYEVALESARAGRARAASEARRAERELARQRELASQDVASPARLDEVENAAKAADAALRQSRAALRQAERNLLRCELRAPYDGRVRDEQVDAGQFVNRGAPVARLYAVDFAEVRLPIPDEELAHLDLALGPEADGAGPEVTLRADFAGRPQEWQARVVRTEGELDPKTRMLTLVARVDDPYGRSAPTPAPLSVGLFVEAEIAGRTVENAVRIPRAALREGDRVWLADAEDRLRIRPAQVIQRGREEVVVAGDLGAGARVILSPLSTPVDGMAVRPFTGEGEAEAAPSTTAAEAQP